MKTHNATNCDAKLKKKILIFIEWIEKKNILNGVLRD